MSRRNAHWPTRSAAARDLAAWFGRPVSVNTMNGWLRMTDCPLPPGRGPIPKTPLYEWYEARFGYAYKYNGSSLVGHELTEKQLAALDAALQKLRAPK